MNKIPVAGLVLLLRVDRFLNEARAVTNLIGNGIATLAVARWEGEVDLKTAKAALNGDLDPSTIDKPYDAGPDSASTPSWNKLMSRG
jgi:DAACS family dicarboxylate/amino acid:cation (Na+ or H+) symporter/aerobic C4-dicarboxylate transport protein